LRGAGMLPCLHSAGTFVMGTKPGVVFCSVCSIPYYRASSEVERAGDTQEPHSKRQHVEEPRDNLFGPPVVRRELPFFCWERR
jgi:hypothetical protein